ncbi:phosphoglucan phosphatase [Chloropicon primus]|nr:phosphoglucan phosphatase [Chloropicon primus]
MDREMGVVEATTKSGVKAKVSRCQASSVRVGSSAVMGRPCASHRRHAEFRRRRILPISFAGSSSSEEYSEVMQAKMGGSLTYVHERGINYTRILPNLIVGSCLQTGADAKALRRDEKVKAVLCLQQDSDMDYFHLDLDPVLEGCKSAGIDHLRCRVNDFDPYDLRLKLPQGVAALHKAVSSCGEGECAYVHCTAGLGRAPGVAIGYMYWVLGMPLLDAHRLLTSKRPCNPKVNSIRQATCDLLFGLERSRVKIGMKAPVNAKEVLVAGLDMGWDNPAECKRELDRFVLERDLPGGRFQYKYIVDGRWTFNADAPLCDDNGNSNNYIDVSGGENDYLVRKRLLSEEATLTQVEKDILSKELQRRM